MHSRSTSSQLAAGTLLHARRDNHARRTFRYPVYMADLDLAELPALDRSLRLFSYRRRNLYSLDDRDYEGGTLDLAELRAANGLPVPATTRLITNLKTLGYVFNPVSFFLDYDVRGALTSVIAEVNNTYGGRRRYVLGPAQRLPDVRGRVGFRHVRELFVSPFLHGDADYEFWFDAPLAGDRIAISMHVDVGDNRAFIARFDAALRPLTDRALAGAALRYPLMTLQVISLIHLEALALRLRGVPYRRPDRDHRPITSPPAILSRPP
ncbi:MAG: DUF1365 domain-containing protein [Deltaproteobacteria bacterium]|nr:DUF1365 domain-containing protein [Deltaproteobacteria bacterium]